MPQVDMETIPSLSIWNIRSYTDYRSFYSCIMDGRMEIKFLLHAYQDGILYVFAWKFTLHWRNGYFSNQVQDSFCMEHKKETPPE